MSSKNVLLRRPRPPNSPVREHLPPISFNSTPQQQSPDIQRNLVSNQDGLRSPVPTMHSGFEPIKRREKHKLRGSDWIVKVRDDDGDDEEGSRGDPAELNMNQTVSYKPRGPDPFPIREPRRPYDVVREYVLPDDSYYYQEPVFRLEDFLLVQKVALPARETFNKTFLSRANYKKLTRLLRTAHDNPDKSTQVAHINIIDQSRIEVKQRRVPRRQVLLEMKKIVQDRLEQLGLTSPSKLGSSEKVVEVLDEIQEMGDSGGVGLKSQMCVFTKATEKVFHWNKRSGSPTMGDSPESFITPTELAILNCLMEGGFVLSLKAHFISHLPDLKPLSRSIVYLNLSFNEFVEFPKEVLSCRDLHVLKLRDNPLTDIPADISKLHHLRTLILSFCCLTVLPLSLFNLSNLEFLDVSYNKLTFLPNEIRRLEKLRFFNVEGNELTGLPCGMLRLNLFRVRVRNNFMNPLLWFENSTNSPQPLLDLCCLKLQKNFVQNDPDKYARLPDEIAGMLRNFRYCDCCGGYLYGQGLRVIRPCTEIWGIRRMPFIFYACSPQCYSSFVHNTDPGLVQLIYGIDSEEIK